MSKKDSTNPHSDWKPAQPLYNLADVISGLFLTSQKKKQQERGGKKAMDIFFITAIEFIIQ